MYLRIRNTLPLLVGAAWLWLSWRFFLDRAPLDSLGSLILSGEMRDRYSDFWIVGWLTGMFIAAAIVDRLWCAFARWRIGVDPMKVHWSKLRNRDGAFFCASCRSIFLLPPPDFDEKAMVRCGDCGHAVAPYGEVKPYLDPQGALRSLRARLWR